ATSPPALYPLSLHDALPIWIRWRKASRVTISIARRADVGRLDEILGRTPEPGPFLVAREVGRCLYSYRSYVGIRPPIRKVAMARSEEHTSELQSLRHLVCRL